MKIPRNVYWFGLALLSACAHNSQLPDGPAHKVSRDYSAIGDASGIHPYVYGQRTLIKFDSGAPALMSIKDENGDAVNYTMQGSYYVLDRKLDSFTISASQRLVRFNLLSSTPPLEVAEVIDNSTSETEPEVLPALEDNTDSTANYKIQVSDPIYSIMQEQMQQHRRLFNIASANPKYTGEELYQINSRLDLIEYKIASQKEAVVHVYFPFNNTEFKPEQNLVDALLPIAKEAVRINIYGRTDSKIADEANKKVAQGRVVSAKDFLVNNGVAENVIHTYPRASGDFIAPTTMEEGRKLNRRVTIEVIM